MSKLFLPFFIILSLLSAPSFAEDLKFVTIGTGGVTGVYYPVGGAVAKLINRKADSYKIKATVEATGGSIFNVNALMAGDLDFGIVQSDAGYKALKGEAEWKDSGPQSDLRSVFSLHSETVNLVVSEKSGIKKCEDLKGKRIAVGDPGSGTRQNAKDALATCGLNFSDLAAAEGLKAVEGSSMLQDERVDGYFYTVGHPNGSLKESTAGRIKVRFIGFPNSKDLIQKQPYYAAAEIAKDLYPDATNESNIKTFGVKATLLTSAKINDDVVYKLTKEVFENLAILKKLHPALGTLKKEDLLTGLSAPIHPGALKYFKEAGLK